MIVRTRERCCRWLAVILCQLLVLECAFSQAVAAQRGLRILVVQGEGTRNVTRQITAKSIMVRVVDANNNPVQGAIVVFTAPASGPSGEFANDSQVIRVTTGIDGLTNAGPYHPNGIEGPYQIQVRTEFQGQMASTVIAQRNVTTGQSHKKVIAIVAIAGAAAGAAIAARNKGSSSASSGTPTITFGAAAVGAPR